MIPGQAQQFFEAAAAQAGASGYEIERSLRFNSADSAYLSRTPSSAGDRRTWTWSGWIKRSAIANHTIFAAGGTVNYEQYGLNIDQSWGSSLFDGAGSDDYSASPDGLLRDLSAWYHIVVAFDTTQATAKNRIKLYLNGELQVNTSSTYPAQLYEGEVNNTTAHTIGRHPNTSQYYTDAYLAEIHFVDGLQLAASNFGEYDDNNVWQPKAYEGDYNRAAIDYSGDSVLTGTIYSGAGSISNLFDGTDTGVGPNIGSFITFTPSTPITINSSLRVKGNVSNASTDAIFAINGSDVSTVSEGFPAASGITQASTTWTTISSPPTTLTSLKFGWETTGSWFSVSGIEVDGVVLLDLDAGVNGFHLDFSDNSSAAALGTDSSGNSNTWTVNNISVSPGAGNDSLIDTPTNYTATSGNNGGNYATLNPLVQRYRSAYAGNAALSNGNLRLNLSTGEGTSTSTIAIPTTGKYYFEVTCTTKGGDQNIQLRTTAETFATGPTGNITLVSRNLSAGSVLGVAIDRDTETVTKYVDGSSSATYTSTADQLYWLRVYDYVGGDYSVNFGQRPFTYTPPTGFKSLCTTNLPDPTIAEGSTATDVALYTGNSTARSITGLNIAPDVVWIKKRSGAGNHSFADTVRGATKNLVPNDTQAEGTEPTYVTAFNSDGFSLGASSIVNNNGDTYVAWTWDAGTTTESNTDGDITSSVRANQSAGFSIVSYTGNGTSGQTVGHGLNATPKMVIFKNRDTSPTNWRVYNTMVDGSLDILYLNLTNAKADSGLTTFTSTTFTAGSSNETNGNGDGMIAYCFAPVEGYSAFGSYTGNGSTDGPFVYTGFQPRWLLTKNTTNTSSWVIHDTTRSTYNVSGAELLSNGTDAEYSYVRFDILSNGFKNRTTNNASNTSGNTYIYAAFAEHPFKTARAR